MAEVGNPRLQKFSPGDAFLFTVGKNVGGSGVDKCANGPTCQPADGGVRGDEFTTVEEIGTGFADRVLVADHQLRRITVLEPDGSFDWVWGKGVAGGAGPELCTVAANCAAGSDGTEAGAFSDPSGVTGDRPATST